MVASYSWSASSDVTPPQLASVGVVDAYTLRVTFTEPVVSAEALVPENYTITGGVSVYNVRQESSVSYILTTSQQTAGVSYTITASNIHDLTGNLI